MHAQPPLGHALGVHDYIEEAVSISPTTSFGTIQQSNAESRLLQVLGVLITNNLTWSAHIGSICFNAKKILGLIYRRFYTSSNQETLKQLYISLVRPHLEYACHVWDPTLPKIRNSWRMSKSLAESLLLTNGTPVIMTCCNSLSSKLWRNVGFTSSLVCYIRFSTISVTSSAFLSSGALHTEA